MDTNFESSMSIAVAIWQIFIILLILSAIIFIIYFLRKLNIYLNLKIKYLKKKTEDF